ncbi:RNA pyrophosphohydrolase [Xanthobacter autotrophicus]|jgi:putative (di)nucleoside polyphosphate hydrolase|uniref:RNA pyrophosphohydrolase n=1 Tax=Xanthobacter autotrophicus TaxID=280 RepID=A0A6C1KT56_XANAU|nr:RNA pyrophosphohydrolase [Xanthobacter autotrophicus]TLX42023.1 RNA pyrophosphohydrolase [Xanthobacter autotrophicus]
MSNRHDKKQGDLPYRPCVGLCVFNAAGKVFLGRRIGGPEHVDSTHSWQLPQGGIDKGEAPFEAALRELYEETSMRSVTKLAEVEDWLSYDLPGRIAGEAWKGKYRGQTQKWFALRFTGLDAEIEIARPGGGHHKPEFMDWRWESLDRVAELVVPFKRKVYEEVVKTFRPFAG